MRKIISTLFSLIIFLTMITACNHSGKSLNVSGTASMNISENTTSAYSANSSDITSEQSQGTILSQTEAVASFEEKAEIQRLEDIQTNEISEEEGDPNYYWSVKGVKETLNFCINNDLWYHGKYSEWYNLIGNTYEVINIQILKKGPEDYTNLSFLFPDKLEFPCKNVIFAVEEAPSGYSEPMMLNEKIITESFDTEQELISFIKSEVSELDENYGCVYMVPKYRYTVSKAVKPLYAETDNKEKEKEKIENKISAQLKDDGLSGAATVYIKDFVAYDIGCKSLDEGIMCINGQTDIFVELNGGKIYWYHYYAEYDGSDIEDSDSAGSFEYVEKISEAKDEYYFNQVKKTTDIVFSVTV